MQEFETEAFKIEEETQKRHEQETEEFQEGIERALGAKPKETSEIINLRKIEESLARQEDYKEAHKVQQKIADLERQEFDKWNHSKVNKIKNLLQQLTVKQENEMNVLRQRIESGYEEQKKLRAGELDKYINGLLRLLQKYQNFMKELENQHHQEIARFDKSIKLQCSIFFDLANNSVNASRMSNMSRALIPKN
jgi:hypothetical protein